MLLLLLYIHLYIQRPHGRHTHTYPRVARGWGPPAAFIISLHRILFFGILVGWMLYCIIISGLSDLEIIWSVFRFPRKETDTDTDTETSNETEWEWEWKWKWESDHFLAVQALLFWVLTTLNPQSTLKSQLPPSRTSSWSAPTNHNIVTSIHRTRTRTRTHTHTPIINYQSYIIKSYRTWYNPSNPPTRYGSGTHTIHTITIHTITIHTVHIPVGEIHHIPSKPLSQQPASQPATNKPAYLMNLCFFSIIIIIITTFYTPPSVNPSRTLYYKCTPARLVANQALPKSKDLHCARDEQPRCFSGAIKQTPSERFLGRTRVSRSPQGSTHNWNRPKPHRMMNDKGWMMDDFRSMRELSFESRPQDRWARIWWSGEGCQTSKQGCSHQPVHHPSPPSPPHCNSQVKHPILICSQVFLASGGYIRTRTTAHDLAI